MKYDQVLYLYKIIPLGNYFHCIPGKKNKLKNATWLGTIHAIFVIILFFFLKTMGIISFQNYFLLVQYLIIFHKK